MPNPIEFFLLAIFTVGFFAEITPSFLVSLIIPRNIKELRFLFKMKLHILFMTTGGVIIFTLLVNLTQGILSFSFPLRSFYVGDVRHTAALDPLA